MMTMYKQRGATFVFWVFFLALIGFLMMLGIKLFPVYYKGFATEKIIEDLALEMQGKKPNKKQLWQSIESHLNVNSIYNVTKDNFVYSKSKKDTIEFGLNYEVRVPAIANLDVIAKFDQRQTIVINKQTFE
jgi:hypothetical protein